MDDRRDPVDRAFQRELVTLVPRLRRFAYALTGSIDQGDDLVQSACERALKNAGQFQPGTRMDSWIFRIIQNLWLDDRRRRQVRGTTIDPESVTLSDDGHSARQNDDRITLARVRATVDTLPDDLRLVLTLVALEGHSYREVADMLEVPIGTVMSRLSRARSKLLSLVRPVDEGSQRWTQ
jgi:RNA polymerase sigma-70 factor, ECF subfamily